MSEQQIKIPHRRLLPSSCTLPWWHQKKSNLLAMPVIVLAPEFPLQNPDGSNFYLFFLCHGEVRVMVDQSPIEAFGAELQKGF